MRAIWLESHDEFEGVGAHELNPRYEHVDGDADTEDAGIVAGPLDTPALARAESMLVSAAGRLDGADTSHYQAAQGMNLKAARAAGLTWWAHKVSQSTNYLDPTWHATSLAMQLAGFPMMLGYHWLSQTTDPVKQADWTLRCMGDLARVMRVMGDCEEQGLTVEWCTAYYEQIEATTHKASAHYTGAFVGHGTIFGDPGLRQCEYGIRPTVLAAYCSRTRMQSLPNVARIGMQAWQFNSNGPVPGVVGRCDMDEISDAAAFASFRPPVESTPEPPPGAPVTYTGGTMYSIIGNLDAAPGTDEGNKRYAWNGVVKIYLTSAKYADFLAAGLLIPGHDSLSTAYMMSTAAMDGYATL